MWYVYRVITTTYGFGLTRVYSSPQMMMILSLGTPPPLTQLTAAKRETPRSADTPMYRAGRYRPETHRYSTTKKPT